METERVVLDVYDVGCDGRSPPTLLFQVVVPKSVQLHKPSSPVWSSFKWARNDRKRDDALQDWRHAESMRISMLYWNEVRFHVRDSVIARFGEDSDWYLKTPWMYYHCFSTIEKLEARLEKQLQEAHQIAKELIG